METYFLIKRKHLKNISFWICNMEKQESIHPKSVKPSAFWSRRLRRPSSPRHNILEFFSQSKANSKSMKATVLNTL